jgi:hypothetical protein
VRAPGRFLLACLLSLGGFPARAHTQSPVPPVRPDTTPPSPGTPAAGASSTLLPDDELCLGFAFRAWTPPLDWKAAGHGERPDPRSIPQAPSGRDWAANDRQDGDTTVTLFPAWWPAGVVVRLPSRIPLTGDTLHGTATALVADGRMTAPRADVLAWRVRCGAPR